jgi:hypothetical protein
MRPLPHACERIFNPDGTALADICKLPASERPATRLWAINQLMILDDSRAWNVFDRALHDEVGEIREIAAMGLQRLDRTS